MSIEADPGSTFLDAEHIVFLMQENRSFDHSYGTLKGVRGFNDPRAIDLPSGLPVWFQQNKQGKSYVPFRLDMKNTKSTWMGSLPHSWKDMVAARNHGKMDQWLEAKKPGKAEYQHLPLTMGYYDRQDIPFYYAFADAFTVCDHHFCSTLTGTSPNRSYFWAGTVREKAHDPHSMAHVNNGQIVFKDVSWKTYPERLEEAGISWMVYQNELSIPSGLTSDEDNWLSNFTNNNLEFHKQYGVRFHPAHFEWMNKELTEVLSYLKDENLSHEERTKLIDKKIQLEKDIIEFSPENFKKQSEFFQNIHRKGLLTNTEDPNYRELEEVEINGQKFKAPKGDIFYQFRKDVNEGKLPTVSWLVAPCNFSDHPGAPWFGAWYVSEALDILTQNPEIWKKTIFILTYDENDGYFDHLPPYVAPNLNNTKEGATTNIPTADEFVEGKDNLGLGFRVPMVIASPWTRGGYVSSEVFDLTSNLQFLEYFLEKKTGKKIIEENIGQWRRAVCGNLTSVFREAKAEKESADYLIDRNETIASVYAAKDKQIPTVVKGFTLEELKNLQKENKLNNLLPKQEPGTKPACPIPYNLMMNFYQKQGQPSLQMKSLPSKINTKPNAAAPFQVYDLKKLTQNFTNPILNFTVSMNQTLDFPLDIISNEYHFKAFAPNGFYREFKGDRKKHPNLMINLIPIGNQQSLQFYFQNPQKEKFTLILADNSYHRKSMEIQVKLAEDQLFVNLKDTNGWYDYTLTIKGFSQFSQRFAGHIGNGNVSITDPLMGNLIKP